MSSCASLRDTNADTRVGKFTFLCHDYVRVADVRTSAFDPMKYPDTREIIEAMNEEKEVVLTLCKSYVLGDRVHGITSIIILDAGKVGAKPIAPGQLYRRSDSSLTRASHLEGILPVTQLWRSTVVCRRASCITGICY